MVCWGAYGVSTTRTRDLAGVLALAVVAGGCAGTVCVRETLVGRPTLAIDVGHSSRRAAALVGSLGVDADGGRLTGVVLALVNVNALVDGEDETWFASAFWHMVLCSTGSPATQH